ncbi:unnamed protein product [Thlaspi arvense]|uniref:DUF668 domain-containing protein n=1 Tax=Thlaspi arvense TaxID=13288 RepID=A0AAU9TAN4_THLAR|nr:unnamed protein product [Thlaspi arvense]
MTVARCNSMPTGLRDTLYQSLPPSIKSSLRSRLRSFHAKEGLTVTEIKDEMEKTLHWLVPIAINTAKAHHGFGWVGEWANTGSEVNRRSTAPMEILQIETFHHADKDRTEAHILELVLWLNHLLRRVKVDKQNGEAKSATKSPIQKTLQEKSPSPMQLAISDPSLELSLVDQNMLQNVISMKRSRGISKSQDFDSMQDRSSKHDRLSRSTGNSPTSGTKEPFPVSSNAMIQFGFDREKTLDAIDGVDTRRR